MDLIGASPAFNRLMAIARKVAVTNAPVLLIGENGTGKELLASYIQRNSRRADSRLVRLSCSAMQETKLESEMFGSGGRPGLLQSADNGTFFLDEITDLPIGLQGRLLRVLQDGLLPGHGSGSDETVDIRFISATNINPFDAIREKRLREDLYFELNVFTIRIPPLRERVQDVPLLANHFLARSWKKHHPPGDRPPSIGDAAMAFLASRRWRGNLRELENVIERLVVLADPGSTIRPDEIPLDQSSGVSGLDVDSTEETAQESYHEAREQMLAHFEKDYITRLVARTSGNMSRAARIANVDRTTLYRMMERNGLRRDLGDLPH